MQIKPVEKKQRRSERGMVVAVTAIGLTAFLLATGMAIDVSNFYLAGTELQNAADAAALAAASSLNSTAAGIGKATDNAVVAMNKFDFNHADVTVARENVKFGVNLSDLDGSGGLSETDAKASAASVRFVKVEVPPKDIGVLFANIALGVDKVSLTRTAVAGQSESGAPGPGDETPNEVCNVYRYVLVEDDVNSDSLDRTDPNCGNPAKYTRGCTYNVHMAPPCGANAGNYEISDYPTTGPNNWALKLAERLPACFAAGELQEVWANPVNHFVEDAVNTLFDIHTAQLPATEYPPDTNVMQNITWAQYKSGDPSYTQAPANAGLPNRRVMILPIMKSSTFAVTSETTAQMSYSKFGAFFLTKQVNALSGNLADMQLEYIDDRITLGDASFNPLKPTAAGANAGLAVAVLYR